MAAMPTLVCTIPRPHSQHIKWELDQMQSREEEWENALAGWVLDKLLKMVELWRLIEALRPGLQAAGREATAYGPRLPDQPLGCQEALFLEMGQ